MPKIENKNASEIEEDRHLAALELGIRIAYVIEKLPSRTAAARLVGRTPESLVNYEKGKVEAPFSVIAKLAKESNVSLEWIATGVPPVQADRPRSQDTFDEEILTAVLLAALPSIRDANSDVSDDHVAQALLKIYKILVDHFGSNDRSRLRVMAENMAALIR